MNINKYRQFLRLRILPAIALLMAAYPAAAAGPLLVATASNMSHAMEEIRDIYARTTGGKVQLINGSSGNFTSQILQGAPFHIFLSASVKYVDLLQQHNHPVLRSSEIARGRLVFFVPATSALGEKTTLDEILNALRFGEFSRIVIANPEFAPYGVAAKQALETAGVWVLDVNKLLVGENAAQATQFSLAGGVDLGIIPYSYAMLPGVKNKGRCFLIPENWHAPIQQYLLLLDDNDGTATEFFNFLFTEPAREIFRDYGYEPAGRQ